VSRACRAWATLGAVRSLPVFLGDDLLTYLVMAMGGALCVGNLFAVARPPAHHREGDMARAPVARSLVMAAIGFLAFAWATASLVAG
jgi:hypothetical protein